MGSLINRLKLWYSTYFHCPFNQLAYYCCWMVLEFGLLVKCDKPCKYIIYHTMELGGEGCRTESLLNSSHHICTSFHHLTDFGHQVYVLCLHQLLVMMMIRPYPSLSCSSSLAPLKWIDQYQHLIKEKTTISEPNTCHKLKSRATGS